MDTKLTKKVFGKNSFVNVVDTEFTEFIIAPTGSTDPFISVEEFFTHYRNIFYDIPKTGLLSHEFLVNQSSDYLEISIEDLKNEISTLRNENIGLKNQIISLTQITGSI